MPWFPPRSLAVRLFLLLLGGVLAAVSTTTALAIHERERIVQSFRDQATADRVADFLHLLAALPPGERFATVRALPSGLWRIDPGDRPHAVPQPFSPTFTLALEEAVGTGIQIEDAWRVIRQDCEDDGGPCLPKRVIGAWVRFPDGQRVHVEGIRDYSPPYLPQGAQFAINLSLLAAFLAVMAWFAVRLVLEPLRSLSQAAEAFGRDPDHPPMDESGPSEVRQAARTFNQMRERLLTHIQERTHILAAVTHDLKTPLTRMRLRLEQCEDEPLRARLVEDVEAMRTLVAEGLELARSLDTGQAPQAVDLAALLGSLCDDAQDAGGDTRYLGPETALVAGRPEALRRVFLNLIDNALKYGGVAAVGLERAGADWLVRIKDAGNGIPERHLAEVMQPFFRLETSRSRETGGTGLGLSIAANLLAAQNGILTLHNRPEGGLEARVRLPALKGNGKP